MIGQLDFALSSSVVARQGKKKRKREMNLSVAPIFFFAFSAVYGAIRTSRQIPPIYNPRSAFIRLGQGVTHSSADADAVVDVAVVNADDVTLGAS